MCIKYISLPTVGRYIAYLPLAPQAWDMREYLAPRGARYTDTHRCYSIYISRECKYHSRCAWRFARWYLLFASAGACRYGGRRIYLCGLHTQFIRHCTQLYTHTARHTVCVSLCSCLSLPLSPSPSLSFSLSLSLSLIHTLIHTLTISRLLSQPHCLLGTHAT